MLDFLSQNWGTILVAVILLAVCGIAAWKMYSDKKQGKSSCGGGCGGCPNAGLCHANKKEDTAK